MFQNALVAFLIGAVGGSLFHVLGAPLPWTLGALAAAATVAIAGGRWLMPNPVRDVARPVVGLLAGSAFTPEVVASIGEWWGAILFVALYSFVASAMGWFFFRRLCGLDRITAFFSSTPGGLGELTLLGAALGGNMRTLVTIHAVRVVTMVFTIPFFLQLLLGDDLTRGAAAQAAGRDAQVVDWLILTACGVGGYLVAKTLRMPGGVMIVAMIFSAIVHGTGLTHVLPPGWLVAIVQIAIGSVAGARFAGIQWREVKTTVAQALVWAAVLLLTACAVAALGAQMFDRPFAALVLAVSPGGMAEMTIISYALGIETAFVITCQVCRSAFVVAFAPLFSRLFGIAGSSPPAAGGHRSGPDGSAPPSDGRPS